MNLFTCPNIPNLRLTERGCAIRYRAAHDPDSRTVIVSDREVREMDFRNPSMWHCYNCIIGKESAEELGITAPPKTERMCKDCHQRPAMRNGLCGPCSAAHAREAKRLRHQHDRTPECLVPGCGNPSQCRGLCNKHYSSWHAGRLTDLFGPWFRGPGNPTLKIKKEEKAVEEQGEYTIGTDMASKAEKDRTVLRVKCRRCEKEIMGSPDEVAKVFQPNKLSNTGFDGVCRKCKNEKRKDTWQRGKAKREDVDPYKIELDFNEDVGLYLDLQEAARADRRDVPNQILAMLDDLFEKGTEYGSRIPKQGLGCIGEGKRIGE